MRLTSRLSLLLATTLFAGAKAPDYPAIYDRLIHWQHDSFLARWRDRELRADAYATFALNHDGSIERCFDFQDLVRRPVSPDSGATH